MAFLGFMTVREHRRILDEANAVLNRAGEVADKKIADRDQHIRGLQIQNQTHVELGRAREKQFQRAIVDRDTYAAELATLKAERERRLAPLAAANAARKAKAQAARGGDVRESV